MRVLSNTSFLLSCLPLLFGTVLRAQSFSYAILPSDTAIIIQQDYCGDSIQWQQFSNGSWVDLAGEQQPSLQLTHQEPENEVKLFRSLTRFANDPVPKISEVTSIRFATTFSELEITDFYDGTHLYHVSPDTLLAATVTDYTAPWGCFGQIIDGADGIGLGTGQQNTLDIIAGCPETYTAALVCDTMTVLGHTDWYLPSADEANAISANIAAENIANFGFTGWYWTSTQAWSTLSTVIAEKAVRKLFRNQGYSYNYFDKSSVKKIVASRTILNPAPHTVYINSYLEEDALAGTIDVSPVAGSLNQFSVEYRGNNHIEGANFEWDFRDGIVLEGGEGPGPHLLCYSFGGYRRLSAKVTSTACSSSTYKSYAFRPQVIENIEAPFPAIYNGKVAFVDYNNDDYPDAFLIGSDTTVLYQNVGSAEYEWVDVPFPPLSNAHAAWGDYDNDGWSDVLFCGITPVDSIPQTYLFRNEEGFQFTETPTILPAISDGFVEWLDYNNDGILDILLSGKGVDEQPLTQLFQGDKNGQFTEVATPFPALLNSSVALEDFNKDNYVDLLLLGKNDTTRYCILYENDQGVFTETDLGLAGLDDGAAAWADFNDDGLLDFYVTGNQEDIIVEQPSPNQFWVSLLGSVYGEIYLQEEGGLFSILENPYHSRSLRYAFNSLETGDFDHDGKSDILTTGMPWVAWLATGIGGGSQDPNDWIHRSKPSVFRNLGDGFTNLELNIPSLYANGSPAPKPFASDSLKQTVMSSFETSSATFGDFNQDGTLDILREGNGMDEVSAIYQHESCVSNSPPSIPAGLTATILNCDSVRLAWQAVSDDHTLASNITYEIYVGTSPGSGDILSQKNKRKLRNTFFELANLAEGTYYWSARPVDGALVRGDYAEEQSFNIIATPDTPLGTACDDGLAYTEEDQIVAGCACEGTLVCNTLASPANGEVDVPQNALFSWAPIPGALGYILNVGLSPGGGELLSGLDVGLANTYQPGDLPLGDTLFVTLTPYYEEGTATACPETQFVVSACPPVSVEVSLDTIICAGGSFQLNEVLYTTSGSFLDTIWTGDCPFAQEVNIAVQPEPVLFDSFMISMTTADTLMLSPNGTYATYLWQDGSTTATLPLFGPDFQPGTYELSLTVEDEEGCIWSQSLQLLVEMAVSTRAPLTDDLPAFFPNPTTGLLWVRLPHGVAEMKLSIFNAQAQRLRASTIRHPEATLDLSNWPAGAYWVRWAHKTGHGTERIVVE